MISIKIVCLFFLFLIVFIITGLVFSKFKINLINFELNTKDKRKIKFKFNFEIYLFNFIKIIIFSSNEKNIEFFNKKMDYIKICEKLRIKDILNRQIKNYFNFKDLNIRLEKINFDCKLGVNNAIITGYIVTIIAITLSYLINRTTKKVEPNLYKFQVLPIHSNKYILELKAECIISIKMIHILYVIKNQKLRRIKENGRTSNRRPYVSSNG